MDTSIHLYYVHLVLYCFLQGLLYQSEVLISSIYTIENITKSACRNDGFFVSHLISGDKLYLLKKTWLSTINF